MRTQRIAPQNCRNVTCSRRFDQTALAFKWEHEAHEGREAHEGALRARLIPTTVDDFQRAKRAFSSFVSFVFNPSNLSAARRQATAKPP
jgi:hypothetical protein